MAYATITGANSGAIVTRESVQANAAQRVAVSGFFGGSILARVAP